MNPHVNHGALPGSDGFSFPQGPKTIFWGQKLPSRAKPRRSKRMDRGEVDVRPSESEASMTGAKKSTADIQNSSFRGNLWIGLNEFTKAKQKPWDPFLYLIQELRNARLMFSMFESILCLFAFPSVHGLEAG